MPKPKLNKKELHFFCLLDTSISMEKKGKIEALNEAMELLLKGLAEESTRSSSVDLKLWVLEFSTGARWHIKNKIVTDASIVWKKLSASGDTDFGAALKNLREVMTNELPMRSLRSGVILLTDGHPTDDYYGELNDIENNEHFKKAIKIGLACGSNCDLEALEEFTGESSLVIKADNREKLKFLISDLAEQVSGWSTSLENVKESESSRDLPNLNEDEESERIGGEEIFHEAGGEAEDQQSDNFDEFIDEDEEDEERLINEDQAQQLLGITNQELKKMIVFGDITPEEIHGEKYFNINEILGWKLRNSDPNYRDDQGSDEEEQDPEKESSW